MYLVERKMANIDLSLWQAALVSHLHVVAEEMLYLHSCFANPWNS
jgi:hypothetical protein